MPDIESNLELRRKIGLCDQDMKRAEERGNKACTDLRRATMIVESIAAISMDEVNAAVEDLAAAKAAWAAARDRKAALKKLLGED